MSLEAWGDEGDVGNDLCACCEGECDGHCEFEARVGADDAGHQVETTWCTYHDREVNP